MKKAIFAGIELVLLAIGTGVFVNNTLANYMDAEEASIGAFMVVAGLLFRSWKNEFFKDSSDSVIISEPIKERREKESDFKPLLVGILAIFAFTFWGLNRRDIKENTSDISSVESNVSSVESKIDDLESNSHYH